MRRTNGEKKEERESRRQGEKGKGDSDGDLPVTIDEGA